MLLMSGAPGIKGPLLLMQNCMYVVYVPKDM